MVWQEAARTTEKEGKGLFPSPVPPTPDMEQQVVTQNQYTPPHWPVPGGHPQKKNGLWVYVLNRSHKQAPPPTEPHFFLSFTSQGLCQPHFTRPDLQEQVQGLGNLLTSLGFSPLDPKLWAPSDPIRATWVSQPTTDTGSGY